ncbi:MAG: AI-2E family transporter [Cyclobacteriaceae bacterium]|nr:AI-2E family transporter [Cyclobacteriaceae bacterium]
MNSELDHRKSSGYNPVIHYTLQLLALSLLLVWCFFILEPFITPLVWAGVLAITLYPAHNFLRSKMGNRNGWSAATITVLMLLIIIGPAFWLMFTTVDEIKELIETYRAGNLHIPPPAETVKGWPLIGSKLYALWTEASTNISSFIAHHQEDAKSIALGALGLLKNTGAGIVIFMLSIVISGFLLTYADALGDFFRQLLIRIAGSVGETMTSAAALTVRNVAKGVLGVAVIQSILAGVGFVLAGIPFAGLWIIICLILAIVQLGLLPVSAGVIIYVWSHSDTTTATLMTIWMLFVGVVDNILKPILLGKGAPAPMLVVFLGAIGGFIFSGFIGLFTGAIVLSLGYKLMIEWVVQSKATTVSESTVEVKSKPAEE